MWYHFDIMARYKDTDREQGRLLAVNLSEQLVEGTFEYTLNGLIDEKLDLRVFDMKYKNDLTGATAKDIRWSQVRNFVVSLPDQVHANRLF